MLNVTSKTFIFFSKKLHFLTCFCDWPLLFIPFQYCLLLTKDFSFFFSFFGQLFIRLSFFILLLLSLLLFNHILKPPHIPHQKALYLLPQEPLLFFIFKK